MLNVALTGNIAAGKSSVARLFEHWGAHLVDADRLVREVQQPGTSVFSAIAKRFGPQVVASDGTLNRQVLRRIIFADAAAREALNALVHPAVMARRAEQVEAARAAGAAVVVNDIPLLFEVTDPSIYDAIVLVHAPAPVRRERLMAMRGLSAADADAMIAAQMPSEAKRALSDYVIDNDGDEAALERAARHVWEELRRRAGA